MTKPIIECRNVFKRYGQSARGIKEMLVGARRHKESRYARDWALQDISFIVNPGTSFGIVGHNGTGKSTLLSLLLGTMSPDSGDVIVRGKTASLLDLGAGFHPELTGRENIYLYGSILGMTIEEIRRKFESIANFSELEDALENPIRTYSNGMITRLGFSIIIHAPAEILLIDEVLAVGDSRFQKKCKSYLHEFQKNGGTLVIVSHDMETLLDVCESGVCLNMGRVYAEGEIRLVVDAHKSLMATVSEKD